MGSGAQQAPVYAPQQVSAEQQASNLQSAAAGQAASNVNQVTPYGTLTYQQSGVGPNGVPTYTATTNLSPAQQQLLETLQGTQKTAGQQASSLLTGANYGGQNPADVIGGMTSGTAQDLLSKEVGYLDPFFKPQIDQLDAHLRNQGLAPGTPAYDQAMNALRQTQNQTVTGFLAQAEPAAYAQATQSYGLPLSLASAELGISQPGSLPGNLISTPGAQVAPTNVVGAYGTAQQAAIQNAANATAANNAMIAGLFSIPAALAGGYAKSSDRRLKTDIQQVGALFDGTPVYRFRYVSDPRVAHIGLMAQDVEAYAPAAVHEIDGFKAVDYALATARAAAQADSR